MLVGSLSMKISRQAQETSAHPRRFVRRNEDHSPFYQCQHALLPNQPQPQRRLRLLERQCSSARLDWTAQGGPGTRKCLFPEGVLPCIKKRSSIREVARSDTTPEEVGGVSAHDLSVGRPVLFEGSVFFASPKEEEEDTWLPPSPSPLGIHPCDRRDPLLCL